MNRHGRRTRVLVAAWSAVLLSAGAHALAADIVPKTWELKDNRWPEVTTAPTGPTQTVSVDPILLNAEQLIRDNRDTDAERRIVAWLKANPTSPLRDRALYMMSEALYQYGDRIRSFFYLDELMDEYPDSRLFPMALQKQFDIADGYLNGYRRRFLGLAILDAEDEAVEMLYRIQQRSPGSPLAERALRRTADYYYDHEEYDLSADVYGVYAKSYPRSPDISRVKLRQAFSNLAQFHGLKFDATPVIDARAQLVDISAEYPDVAREENIPAILKRIDATFARKLLVTADFYKRTSEPRAAVYTYRYLAATFPDSAEARTAEEKLKGFSAAVLASPPPGKSNFFAPSTTQPVATTE